MVKLPSKSETAPWFCPWITILTPTRGSPSSESVTEPERFCACNPVRTGIKEIKKLKNELYHIIAEHSGQDFDKVWKDSDRDYWMTSEEAKSYGMIDEVLDRKK